MSMDPNRWINTIPFIGTTSNQEKYKLDSNRWVNTLPTYNNPTYSKKNGDSSTKKYPLVITLFVVGLIVVSVIKNETRNMIAFLKNKNKLILSKDYIWVSHNQLVELIKKNLLSIEARNLFASFNIDKIK